MSMIFRTQAEFGLEGAEAAILWDHGCSGIVLEGDSLVAWFDEEKQLPLAGEWQPAPDIDYVARYYSEVGPVAVGSLVIAPTHDPVTLDHGQKPLWLDPGMAFGSGHHDTTHSLLEILEETGVAGKRVLDVGSGSGILAIAADLLGASLSVGIDNDQSTVEVARGNARLNHSRASFEWATLGEYGGPDPFAIDPATGSPVSDWPVGDAPVYRAGERFDVLVANLFAALHLQLLPAYLEHLSPGGLLLLSGIMAEQAAEVQAALSDAFSDVRRQPQGDWVSFRAGVRD